VPKDLKIKTEQLKRYFDQLSVKSFTVQKFIKIFEVEWKAWGIEKTTSSVDILNYVVREKIFAYHQILDRYGDDKSILSYNAQNDLTIISGLKPEGYFTYQTAMQIHGWAKKSSKMIYLNIEHTKDKGLPIDDNELSQETIDYAFGQPQRQNQNLFIYKNKTIMVTNGKKTDRLGVVTIADQQQYYAYTDMERTLIDIVVRPVYAGNVRNILKAFKKAKGSINIETLKAYLDRLNYIYPYHQAIGFYLEKAGYPMRDQYHFIQPHQFDFYLTHDMDYPIYNEKWHIYHPEEIE